MVEELERSWFSDEEAPPVVIHTPEPSAHQDDVVATGGSSVAFWQLPPAIEADRGSEPAPTDELETTSWLIDAATVDNPQDALALVRGLSKRERGAQPAPAPKEQARWTADPATAIVPASSLLEGENAQPGKKFLEALRAYQDEARRRKAQRASKPPH